MNQRKKKKGPRKLNLSPSQVLTLKMKETTQTQSPKAKLKNLCDSTMEKTMNPAKKKNQNQQTPSFSK